MNEYGAIPVDPLKPRANHDRERPVRLASSSRPTFRLKLSSIYSFASRSCQGKRPLAGALAGPLLAEARIDAMRALVVLAPKSRSQASSFTITSATSFAQSF